MVEFLFTTKEGLVGNVIEAIGGGVSALAGIYVWDKLMGPVNQFLSKWLGNYGGPITAFVLSLLMLHIARSQEGMLGRFLQVMAYSMFGDAIAKSLGIDPVMVPLGIEVQNVSPWSTLEPVPLPAR